MEYMEITAIAIRRLQRALNALNRGSGGARRLAVDGRLGRRTIAMLFRFLSARGAEGEAALVRAIAVIE